MSHQSERADAPRALPVREVQRALLAWYREHRRDLPWRRTQDPYRIWLSEVMLQQTQVETAWGYYERFITRFPTLERLAEADVDEVLELWAGLGYYRRARNFHAAVKEVAQSYGGEVPQDAKVFGSLPGVGPYTTGAVLSIAYGEPIPAIDGNVMRVLSRLAAIADPIDRSAGRRRVEEAAATLLAVEAPGDWNQVLMELGALVCRPKSPKCHACPVARWCLAALDGTAEALPVSTRRSEVRRVERLVGVVEVGGDVVLTRRPEDGLLGGLWDLPAVEGEPGTWALPGEREQALLGHLADLGFEGLRLYASIGTTSHKFSHVEWQMHVYRCRAAASPIGAYLKVPKEEILGLPLPRATGKVLELAFRGEATAEV